MSAPWRAAGRRAAVVAGLAATGAVLGAAGGFVAGAVGSALTPSAFDAIAIGLGTWLGLPIGATLAPLLGLTLLRRVPLWQAVLLPSAAAVAVGALSFPLASIHAPIYAVFAATAAAVALYGKARADARRTLAPGRGDLQLREGRRDD